MAARRLCSSAAAPVKSVARLVSWLRGPWGRAGAAGQAVASGPSPALFMNMNMHPSSGSVACSCAYEVQQLHFVEVATPLATFFPIDACHVLC